MVDATDPPSPPSQRVPPPQPPADQDESPSPETPTPKRWVGRLVALGFGLLLIILAEMTLSLMDYNGPTRMFVKIANGDGTESYVTNFGAFRSTFASNPVIRVQNTYSAPPPQRFLVEKPAGTYRIAVMGGSAAMGFPHNDSASIPRFLEGILNTVCDGPRVEVINAGVSAISSFSVRERVDEVLDCDVDMLVVYCGNNEFYGAYAPGSAIALSSRRPLTLLQMWLRRRRLSMAMGNLVAAVSPRPAAAELRKRLAAIMPQRTDIAYGDELYTRVRRSYEANLRDVVKRARRRGVVVVVCTVAVNLRSFPPMGSLHPPGAPADGPPAWKENSEAGDRALQSDDLQEAAARLRAAVEASPGHADTHYRYAQCLEALERYEEAAEHYTAAADRDTVRWRAGSDYAGAAATIARDMGDPGVLLADTAAQLRRHAEHGIPGDGLFLEHVHLTETGSFLIAEEAARVIAEAGVPSGPAGANWGRHLTAGQYAAAAGHDALDRIEALQRMERLYAGALTSASVAERRRREFSLQIEELYMGLDAPQATTILAVEVSLPTNDPAYYDWTRILLATEYSERGQVRKALAEMGKLRRYGTWQLYNTSLAGTYETQANILLRNSDPEGAAAAARQALTLEPGLVGAMEALASAYRMLGRPQEAQRWEESAAQADAERH